MEKFASIELRLNKDVKKGDSENLLSLFSFHERIKRMEVLLDMEEDEVVRISLGDLGEVDLKLGTDMEKGQKKTIMTFFWLPEKSKPIEIKRDARAGDKVVLTIWS